MHTLKPFDKEIIEKAARETGKIITVEEHSIYGGLGGSVAEIIAQTGNAKLKILGIPDETAIHATPLEIFKYYGIDAEGILKTAVSF
jgi:transketolase